MDRQLANVHETYNISGQEIAYMSEQLDKVKASMVKKHKNNISALLLSAKKE